MLHTAFPGRRIFIITQSVITITNDGKGLTDFITVSVNVITLNIGGNLLRQLNNRNIRGILRFAIVVGMNINFFGFVSIQSAGIFKCNDDGLRRNGSQFGTVVNHMGRGKNMQSGGEQGSGTAPGFFAVSDCYVADAGKRGVPRVFI